MKHLVNPVQRLCVEMSSRNDNFRRVLGRVVQQDFVGRTAELDRIMAQAERGNAGRGLLVLMEPSAGV